MLDMYIFKNEVHVTFFSHCQSYSFSFFLFIVARIFLNSFVEGLDALLVHFGPYYTAQFVHCSTSKLLFNTF